MPLFLVRYAVTHVGHYGPEIVKERAHHALLVDSPSRVDAFATAYDHLSHQSLAVSTMLTNKYKHLTFDADEGEATGTRLNFCGMSDEDLDELQKRRIPVDKFEGNTDIVSITEHKPEFLGRVVSEKHKYVEEGFTPRKAGED